MSHGPVWRVCAPAGPAISSVAPSSVSALAAKRGPGPIETSPLLAVLAFTDGVRARESGAAWRVRPLSSARPAARLALTLGSCQGAQVGLKTIARPVAGH